MTATETQATQPRLDTGVPGLDKILHGGFIAGRSYFVSGGAGAGKTTLGLHFLAQAAPEDSLLVSLSEPQANIRADARTIGLDIDETHCIDISPTAQTAGTRGSYTLLEPWDAEPLDLLTRISDTFKEKLPKRIFLDALSQYRHHFPDAYQFRRQVLELLEYLSRCGVTVLISSEAGSAADEDLQYLGDGMLRLAATPSARTLSVAKFRGSGFSEGEHTVRLTDGGMRVFECLVPAEHHRNFTAERLSSGVDEVDVVTGGGLDRGTVTLLSGPSGVGKTTLGAQFMREAASLGERSVIFSFEERTGTLLFRCQSIGIPLDDVLQQGTLLVREIEPLRYGPDEFASEVRREVEAGGAQIVMIDSLAGYRQSVQGGQPRAPCPRLVSLSGKHGRDGPADQRNGHHRRRRGQGV